jgi:hypothetical protein
MSKRNYTNIYFKQRKGSRLFAEVEIRDGKRVATGTVKFKEEDIVTLLRMFASVLECKHAEK